MTKCDVPASIAFVLPQTPFRKYPETSKGLGSSQQPVFCPQNTMLAGILQSNLYQFERTDKDMKKHYIDKQTGIIYTLQEDYYVPDRTLPAEEEKPIGIWGLRRLRFLEQHRRGAYSYLLTTCQLNGHLAAIDEQARSLLFQLVKEMAEKEQVTEELKAADQMQWVQRMNNIRHRAEEIVYEQVIYV